MQRLTTPRLPKYYFLMPCSFLLLVALFIILAFSVGAACAMNIALAWNANSEEDLSSYKIYYKTGTSGPPYDGIGAYEGDSPIIVTLNELNDPENPEYKLHNLDSKETYYLAVTAINEHGESGFSDEISVTHSNKNLVFTPTTPCRIVDTRLAGGAIPPGGIRSYNVYGAVASQGGNPAGCPSSSGEPRAVALNVTAVPLGNGNIVVYPFASPVPNTSFINYRSDAQNVSNSGTVKTCLDCTKDVNIKSNFGTAHVAIDVLGYYYSMP